MVNDLRKERPSAPDQQATDSFSSTTSNSGEDGQEDAPPGLEVSRALQRCRPHVTDVSRGLLEYFLHRSMIGMRQRRPTPIPTGIYQNVAVGICLDEPIFYHALVAIAGVDRAVLPACQKVDEEVPLGAHVQS